MHKNSDSGNFSSFLNGLFSSGSRAAAISKYRSPHTRADEFLLIAPFIQLILAAWCMWIGFASYQAFFGHSFGPTVAWVAALLLCIVIEFGKLKVGGYVFQKPFLEGTVGGTWAQFFVWVGALVFSVATFWMSIINSTSGAHALATLKGNQAHAEAFTPSTDAIDAQIREANARIQLAHNTKWKGTTTYEAQKAITRDTRTIESLQKQRDAAVTIQRSDFERRQSQNDLATNTGADMVMAAGGWVEILQVVLLFFVAACMAVVGEVMEREEKQRSPTANLPTYNGAQKSAAINNGQPGTPPVFMFNRMADGQVRSAPDKNTVPQFSQSVPQTNATIGCNAVLAQCKEAVQKDLSNFENRLAKPGTVSERINRALDECLSAISTPGFEPDREVAIRFFEFLKYKAFPSLNARGYGYELQDQILSKISGFVPEQV